MSESTRWTDFSALILSPMRQSENGDDTYVLCAAEDANLVAVWNISAHLTAGGSENVLLHDCRDIEAATKALVAMAIESNLPVGYADIHGVLRPTDLVSLSDDLATEMWDRLDDEVTSDDPEVYGAVADDNELDSLRMYLSDAIEGQPTAA